MQRVWATGTEADRGPMEWIGSIRQETIVADHIREAFAAANAAEASLEACLAGMLAVESATYVLGGDADLHPLLQQWMNDVNPRADETLREAGLALLAKLQNGSALATHFAGNAAWSEGVENLRRRLAAAKRKPDPAKDPRVIALADDFNVAKQHLRVALVPYDVADEPSVNLSVAPGLSVVVHYVGVGDLEPVPVPADHAKAWDKTPKAIAKLAAKQTRDVLDLRTHILENEGFEINVAFGDSSFTAGLLAYADLLLLNDFKAPHGMLIAAPNAGTVVYHRILDAKWNEASVEVIKQAREIFSSTGSQISPQLWWWHEGKVIELPYQIVLENYIIEPVEAFMAVVKPLVS